MPGSPRCPSMVSKANPRLAGIPTGLCQGKRHLIRLPSHGAPRLTSLALPACSQWKVPVSFAAWLGVLWVCGLQGTAPVGLQVQGRVGRLPWAPPRSPLLC